MSASVGIVASFSRAVLASPECAWHHQNTAFTRLTDVSPRWLRRTALSCEFTPPSIMLLVDGSGPALARAGSRWVNSVHRRHQRRRRRARPPQPLVGAGPPAVHHGPVLQEVGPEPAPVEVALDPELGLVQRLDAHEVARDEVELAPRLELRPRRRVALDL